MKQNRQSDKKRKFTFNIVDALIILILATIIATVVYVFVLGKSVEDLYSKETEITYTVSINDVDGDIIGYICEGDKAYHSGKDKYVGTITAIEHSPSDTGNGIDIIVTVSTKARVNNDGVYSINGDVISKGTTVNVRFAKYQPQEAICKDIIAK